MNKVFSRKIIKYKGKYAVRLPKPIINTLGLKVGDKMKVTKVNDSTLIYRKIQDSSSNSGINFNLY